MYLVDLIGYLETKKNNLDNDQPITAEIANNCDEIYQDMRDDESIWVYSPHMFRYQGEKITSMDIYSKIQNKTNLFLRDMITIYRYTDFDAHFLAAFEEGSLFVKDVSEYYFDKDAIRTDPVYRGDEWNGERQNGRSAYRDRTTKRYNPDGKDPGNVWLNEIRTESKGKVLDRTKPFPQKETIHRCIRASSRPGETITLLWPRSELVAAIDDERNNVEILTNHE